MSELPDLFQRATEHFGDLVHQVSDGEWGAPTPCAEWDVRALVNHLVYEARWAPPLLDGQTIEQVGSRFDGDLLGDDPVAAWDEARGAALAAVGAPGALDGTVHLSYGETPAPDYVRQLTCDFVVHSWDLARGLGADETIDDDLLRFAYDEALPNVELIAASGLFDPPVDVPEDADLKTKTLALFGRRA